MTCKELINNLQYSSGVKLNLPLWEKEFILTRAKEENLSEKEMNILKKCIHNDMFVFGDKNIIYNLLTGEAYNIHDICKKYNINIYTLKYKIKEKNVSMVYHFLLIVMIYLYCIRLMLKLYIIVKS